MTLLEDWNHTDVMWFDNFPLLWEEHKNGDPMLGSEMLGDELANRLGLPMCTLNAEQSKFFKRHYNNDKYNEGPLVKEMDVIRRIEGW
jgi:hypothetical protein